MSSRLRKYGYTTAIVLAVIAVFGAMFITIANQAPNYEPSTRPSVTQAMAADPFMNIQRPAPFGFKVRATDCSVQFPDVTAVSERGICSVKLNRTTYPYVMGSGTSCNGIDLTWADNYKPERGQWVIRLKNDATFDISPITQAMADTAIGPEPSGEFTGAVKDQYGEDTVSCGTLPVR